MLRILPQRSITSVWYTPASVLRRATSLQPCNTFSHSTSRLKKPLTFKKPSETPQEPRHFPFEKASRAPNHPETRSQMMNRIGSRERALVRAGVKSRREMFKTIQKELEQWELEHPEAAAAFNRRFNIVALIVALPGSIYLTDWTVRCIPYGWPGGIRELHEENRAKILRFFGLGEPAELEAQMNGTSTKDKRCRRLMLVAMRRRFHMMSEKSSGDCARDYRKMQGGVQTKD